MKEPIQLDVIQETSSCREWLLDVISWSHFIPHGPLGEGVGLQPHWLIVKPVLPFPMTALLCENFPDPESPRP